MKQHLFLISTVAILLLGNSKAILANMKASDEVFILEECVAYVPDVPDLPQDEDFLCGDVNEDGLVNVLDIISMVNYIMGGNPSPFNTDAANINADGEINVLDIIALVNIIMQVPGMACGCVAPVLYEGQTYPTVQIGGQCWFRENLNVGTMINSDAGGQLQINNGIKEKYCYDNTVVNCDIYGGLYEWNEAMQYVTAEGAQGICPVGWHIPSDGEWKVLEGTVDSQYAIGDPEWDKIGGRGFDAGGKLKEVGTTHWLPPNTGATNSSGFTGLPGGCRDNLSGSFDDLGDYSYIWSSSQNTTYNAWSRCLGYITAVVYRGDSNKEYAFSVRCLKGCWPQPTQANAGPDQVNVPGTSTNLAGNTPTYGTGLWAIVSGTDGTILDPTNPTSEFQGVAGNEYTLSWTITTVCGSSADTVVISFMAAMGQPCPGMPTVEYEGQIYNTVQIGNQCWLRENLNVGMMISSTSGGYQQTDNGTIEKYCYNNDEANCVTYGGLYEWPEAMQFDTTNGAKGICPTGWHISTDKEWKMLEGTVDSQHGVGCPEWDGTGCRGYDAGGNLKESGFMHWYPPNTGATNSSGYTSLPGGDRMYLSGAFIDLNIFGRYWTSTQSGPDQAWYRDQICYLPCVIRDFFDKGHGLSVRCLKDD
ncbi:MAG: FISUMP domain-containing protein [Bacteroidales bacterium]|nr:hypothetical protein [Lentimicrobiaceae bacterium]MDD5694112.1 FISUMP domain-containing protein [Bacteroidales bacterium]